MLEAYLRAERFDKAEDMLRTRLKRRASVRDTYWLGRAQEGTGRYEAAAASFSRATEGWQGADSDLGEMVSLGRAAAGVGHQRRARVKRHGVRREGLVQKGCYPDSI